MDGDEQFLDARALDWSCVVVARLREKKRDAVELAV
jgi:hypothetical protein